ncbi:MAG: hypothetical protein WC250_00795 [Candidatus Paceibacterota bacterium]|jgi:hypothetical protein
MKAKTKNSEIRTLIRRAGDLREAVAGFEKNLRRGFLELSQNQTELARLTSPKSRAGIAARDEAIFAAIKAGERDTAHRLIKEFAHDTRCSQKASIELMARSLLYFMGA